MLSNKNQGNYAPSGDDVTQTQKLPKANRERRYYSMACSSVTLVHPAEACGLNEMPFGSDIPAAPYKIALDSGAHKTQEMYS